MGDCPGLDASLGSGGKSDRSPLVQAKQRGKVAVLGITLQLGNSCLDSR